MANVVYGSLLNALIILTVISNDLISAFPGLYSNAQLHDLRGLRLLNLMLHTFLSQLGIGI